jgi:hypothetical protein
MQNPGGSDKQGFQTKHPRWSAFMGMIFLGLISLLIVIVLKALAIGCKNLFMEIMITVSKLDAVIIVALITGSVSVVGVIISSVVAKIIDYKKSRREYLSQKREIPYADFVEMIYKILDATKNGNYDDRQMNLDVAKFSKQLTLWGSARVVNKWVEFRETAVSNPQAAKNNLLVLEEIMNEMRHDLGVRKVKKGNLLAFFINNVKEEIDKLDKNY